MPDWGSEIEKYREASGITKVAVARKLGIDSSYLGKMEKGTEPMNESFYHRCYVAIDKSEFQLFKQKRKY